MCVCVCVWLWADRHANVRVANNESCGGLIECLLLCAWVCVCVWLWAPLKVGGLVSRLKREAIMLTVFWIVSLREASHLVTRAIVGVFWSLQTLSVLGSSPIWQNLDSLDVFFLVTVLSSFRCVWLWWLLVGLGGVWFLKCVQVFDWTSWFWSCGRKTGGTGWAGSVVGWCVFSGSSKSLFQDFGHSSFQRFVADVN